MLNSSNNLHISVARKLAIKNVKERKDCNKEPVIKNIDQTSYPGFILVDIEYNNKGNCALYEYRCKDGFFCLAQD